ncbi:MAG: glycoside hydrolase family 3 protein [Thermoleophilia bacterium]|nr:glycoside hydrolase family 3 protein [Thermoleophilia bacterium]
MTLRDKAAQVLLLAFDGTTMLSTTKELLMENPLGGFLLLSRNVTGAEQVRSLCATLQQTAADAGADIGLFIAVDQEGGSVQRIHSGAPRVPAARVLGEAGSLMDARTLAAETAIALLELGVNLNLAPVADVVSDATSFLYDRTYAGDPALVSNFVKAVTEAFVQNGLVVAVKHFPGHGSAPGDTHGEPVISHTSEYDFATIHLRPFKAALAAGAQCVMMAHIVADAYDPVAPASLSRTVIEEVLREGLGFSGVVVADDLEMAGAAAALTEAAATEGAAAAAASPEPDPGELAVRALEAGCDLLISTGPLPRQTAMIDAIAEAVRSGRLSESRLNEAVTHVLDVKWSHGIVARTGIE